MANPKVEYRIGDCLEVLREFPDDHFDSCVTDPPYFLIDDSGKGFMGKNWDSVKKEDIYGFHKLWAEEVYRVLKPGAHLLSFGGTRTHHRMTCALEDVGFEIRDCLMWLYGSGFPKSHDVSKAIDKHLGCFVKGEATANSRRGERPSDFAMSEITASNPQTPEALKWNGWGTALKPAYEPIVLARKPLEGTVAKNVLKYGTGGINVDGCRIDVKGEQIGTGWADSIRNNSFSEHEGWDRPWKKNLRDYAQRKEASIDRANTLGRWPSNVILDEESAKLLDEQSGELKSGAIGEIVTPSQNEIYGKRTVANVNPYKASIGGASRFFYVAKASRSEREKGLESDLGSQKTGHRPAVRCKICERQRFSASPCQCSNPDWEYVEPSKLRNFHPTVKPLELMRYLVRLVTPKDGICLDPFLGSGTTLLACRLEGFNGFGIEKEIAYEPIIRERLAYIPPALEGFESDEVSPMWPCGELEGWEEADKDVH